MDDIKKLESIIEKKEIRIKELENQKSRILNDENHRKRKERTRQLIQMGALSEKFFDIHDVKELQEFYTDMAKSKNKEN